MSTTPDTPDSIAYRLSKAHSALRQAQILAEAEEWDGCVNRLYYACFYAVTALLYHDQRDTSKHTGVRSLFNQYYVHTQLVPASMGVLFNKLFAERHEVDYDDFIVLDSELIKPWLSEVEAFIIYIQTFLDASSG